MLDPNRRYAYLAFVVLAVIWFWVLIGRPTPGGLFDKPVDPVKPLAGFTWVKDSTAMSLYYEAADVLKAPTTAGGSLKSRIFSKKDFKAAPAQIYALVIETCKWSAVLKEVIEKTGLLGLERKLTPLLSLLLVHDLLLAKRGIALPATHGLRASIERHKARLTAEFTRARIRRGLGSLEALTEHVEAGGDNTSGIPVTTHPRWIRVNTLKTTLEDQLNTTFKDYSRTLNVGEVQKRGGKKIYLDAHIPNLVAVPPSADLTKSAAYTSGALIFQDKASCFPAYLLDPLPEDGDVIDSCAAPGNKTTHLASILASHSGSVDIADPTTLTELPQRIHAFEKDKLRATTLAKMTALAGSDVITKIHAATDFLKADPEAAQFANVGALLLDPSCSGSGIVGRDDMPELHLPSDAKGGAAGSVGKAGGGKGAKGKGKGKDKPVEEEKASQKRKREGEEEKVEVLLDDDGVPTAITSAQDLQARLAALAAFQLTLLLHAMRFPAARKITYSTCSEHNEENEGVVLAALESEVAKKQGWRVLKREEQVGGMKRWDVRGVEGEKGEYKAIKEGCIRANKGDGEGTMGFFVCAFVRDSEGGDVEAKVVRDESGKIVRDAMGVPVLASGGEDVAMDEDEEWGGIGDEDEEPVVESVLNGDAVVDEESKEGEEASKPAKKKRRKAKKKT
ncbi:hypothetical protein O988_07556 [Pseudogymnoascus sp. VKM F-3808]|nr:hypothetical protein O988_07556 [Pseudogymnoascus sp. VKM F-3808]